MIEQNINDKIKPASPSLSGYIVPGIILRALSAIVNPECNPMGWVSDEETVGHRS